MQLFSTTRWKKKCGFVNAIYSAPAYWKCFASVLQALQWGANFLNNLSNLGPTFQIFCRGFSFLLPKKLDESFRQAASSDKEKNFDGRPSPQSSKQSGRPCHTKLLLRSLSLSFLRHCHASDASQNDNHLATPCQNWTASFCKQRGKTDSQNPHFLFQ